MDPLSLRCAPQGSGDNPASTVSLVPKLGLNSPRNNEPDGDGSVRTATPSTSSMQGTPRYGGSGLSPAAAEAAGGELPAAMQQGTPRYGAGGAAAPTAAAAPAGAIGTPRYGVGGGGAAADDAASSGGGAVGQQTAGLGTLPAGGVAPGTPRYEAPSATNGGAAQGSTPPPATGKAFQIKMPGGDGDSSVAGGGTVAVGDVALTLDGDEPLSAPLENAVEAQVTATRKKFERDAAIRAAEWLVARDMRAEASKTSEGRVHPDSPALLEAIAELVGKAELPTPPFDGLGGGAASRTACEKRWKQRIASLKEEVSASVEGAEAAEATAKPWAAKMLEAKRMVIDPNMEQLAEHLKAMRADQLDAMARDVRRMPSNVQQAHLARKATSAQRVLQAALDDVEGQFNGGMLQLARPMLEQLDDVVSAPEGQEGLITRLVSDCCHAHRLLVEEEFASTGAMVDELTKLVATPAPALAPKESEAKAFISTIILGNYPLALPPDQYDFLTSQVAIYLDPFIDGEVPKTQYEERSKGHFLPRLQRAWAADPEKSGECPIPPNLALTQYVRHLVIKMNMQLGFGQHIPGLGRQPISPPEQDLHIKKLIKAIEKAVESDFPPNQRSLSAEMPRLQLDVLTEVSKEHLKSLFVYQEQLGQALAIANRDGEEARRQERLRIWGYC